MPLTEKLHEEGGPEQQWSVAVVEVPHLRSRKRISAAKSIAVDLKATRMSRMTAMKVGIMRPPFRHLDEGEAPSLGCPEQTMKPSV